MRRHFLAATPDGGHRRTRAGLLSEDARRRRLKRAALGVALAAGAVAVGRIAVVVAFLDHSPYRVASN